MTTVRDNYPEHHADCQVRRGNDRDGRTCNCADLRRQPRLTEPGPRVDHDAPDHDRRYCATCDNRAVEPHWLAEVDAIAVDTDTGQGASGVVAARIRELVMRETEKAYAAGRLDAMVGELQARLAEVAEKYIYPSTDLERRVREAMRMIPGHQTPQQTALVYGGSQQLLDAANALDRVDALVDDHGDAIRAWIGSALANAEKYGKGWIRIGCTETPGQPGTYDWTFEAPSPLDIQEDR